MSGPNAEKLLVARDESGTFLVRESLSKPGDFVLSVLTDEKTKSGGKRVSHIKIMCQVGPCPMCVSVCDHVCVGHETRGCFRSGFCFENTGLGVPQTDSHHVTILRGIPKVVLCTM